VLVDGRSVYSPLFSGVFWDHVDALLEDIDRIEVIRGPGAAICGSNAVNGVIDIITKRAQDTQGMLVSVSAGADERRVGARFGTTTSDGTQFRVFALNVDRNDTSQIGTATDGGVLRQTRFGMRAEKQLNARDHLRARELFEFSHDFDAASGACVGSGRDASTRAPEWLTG